MQRSIRRGLFVSLGILGVCALTGCYAKVSEGSTTVYHFSTWTGVAAIGGGLLALPIGWILRSKNQRFAFVLMGLGVFGLTLIGPSMFTDRVVVAPDHFEASYGVWFSPSVHKVRFDDLSEIRYVSKPARRGSRNYELHCVEKGGNVKIVHSGTLVSRAVPDILAAASARNLPVTVEDR
jgi:hypothetical protein